MATEVPDAPQVFARKATGLRREASARDVFIYNTNNQNVGIGVAFVVLLVAPFYVGASMVTCGFSIARITRRVISASVKLKTE